jgi:hypothetical protein
MGGEGETKGGRGKGRERRRGIIEGGYVIEGIAFGSD